MFYFRHLTKEQFAELWAASREKFYRMAFCYTKNEQDALEILSEATYRGYCHLGQLQKAEFFDTWMCRIIIHEACRFLKQKKRWASYDGYEETADDRAFQEAEEKIDVYKCLDGLAVEEKTLLVLRYFEERTFREIAGILSMPESTVKTRTYQLLKRLREKEEIHGNG